MISPLRATLSVRLQPRASKNEVVGFKEGILYLRLTAPPVENTANRALEAFVADLLGVRKSQVSVIQGQKSRDKVLEILGLSSKQVHDRLSGKG